MKKLFTVIAALLLVVAVFCQMPDLPTSGKYRIVWYGDATATATVAWEQISGENPVVYYGPEDFGTDWQKYPHQQKPTRVVPDYRGMDNHFARLTGLQPDQAYYFVIKDSKGVGDRYWFKTAPAEPKPFTFVAGGDTKSSGDPLIAGRLSNQMAAKLRPLFAVFVGDFTSGDGLDAGRWREWLEDWFTLTTTEDGRMLPIVPVNGNHESGDYTVLHNLFDVPFQAGNMENIYYDLVIGQSLALLVLNSQVETGDPQLSWIEEKLREHQDKTFTAVTYHKPFFPHTSGKRENWELYEKWAPLFYQYGVDLSFDGDSHMSKITFPLRPDKGPQSHLGFVRDDEKGTMFIGEGSWGASPRPADDPKPWTIRTGSFNQIKWLQVFPQQGDQPAHVDIRTVITASFEDGKLVDHVTKVKPLSEANIFAEPEGIDLFSTEPYGAVITYPFREN